LWSRQLTPKSQEFYRIAYHLYRNNHISTLAPVFNRTPMYKVGYTPAQIFQKVPRTDEEEVLDAASVKYVMSGYELANPQLTLERTFGELRVYRRNTYRPQPFTVLGEGHAELLEFEPERIRIRLSDTTPSSRLKINVANFPRWRATIAGKEVPIATVPVYGVEYPFLMEVPASDGELVLEYVYRTADWAGLLLSLAALPGLAAALWIGQKSSIFASSLGMLERALRSYGWMVLVALAVAVGLVLAATQSRTAPLAADSIFRQMQAANLRSGNASCSEVSALSFECGGSRVRADVVTDNVLGAWGVYSCMSAPDAGELLIRKRLKLGSFLEGSYYPAAEGEGSIKVSADGQELGSASTRPLYLWRQVIQFDTRAFKDREATVELSLKGAALHCFDFRIIR
jgi:hypothetical protein